MQSFLEFIFWNKTLHVSDSSSVHHQQFFTVHTAMVYVIQLASRSRTFRPDPARKLSANLYDVYHCCVYSEKLLVMDRGAVRNKFEKLVHLVGFITRTQIFLQTSFQNLYSNPHNIFHPHDMIRTKIQCHFIITLLNMPYVKKQLLM